ncbi:MAG: Tolloid-like protein 1, partial [Anaerolineae bacterium]|nr:Tolloid-like protein 1 [Anaerolineae bacterium]
MKALELAVEINPANAPSNPFEAAAETRKLWKPGMTLRVKFMEGAQSVQEKVEKHAREWERHAH